MRTLDASAILHGWDNYPPPQFPRLWEWMAERVQKHDLAIADVALDEVAKREPDCAKWLRAHEIEIIPVSDASLAEASRIKQLLGIEGDAYHPKGVGENDLLIIAAAKILGVDLITNEQRQPTLPPNLRQYKLPAVGDLPAVQVQTLSFLDYLKLHQAVFG